MKHKKITSKTNPVDALVIAVKNQQETISILLKTIQKNASKNRMVEAKQTKKQIKHTSGPKKGKKKTNFDLFVETVKHLNKPATTMEIAEEIKRLNPKFKAMEKRNPKGFMQFIYSAASLMSNAGVITKHKLNEKAFTYTFNGKESASVSA